jgi:hypothetical protein
MKTFVLLKRFAANPDFPPRFEWWEMGKDGKLFNEGGGWNILISTDVVIETIKLKNWTALWTKENIAKTSHYQTLAKNSTDKSLKIGWLAPDGTMHYCEYSDHISYVHVVLDSDVPTIEEQGWLHIVKGLTSLHPKRRMTQSQARTAKEELGLIVFDEDILY